MQSKHLRKQSFWSLPFAWFGPSVFMHPFSIHMKWKVSEIVILPLTFLMHSDDTPTTDCRPSKNIFMAHFVARRDCNQTFFFSTLWLPRSRTVICGGRNWLANGSFTSAIYSRGTFQTGKVVVARCWNGQCPLGWKAFSESIKNLFSSLEATTLSSFIFASHLNMKTPRLSLTASPKAAELCFRVEKKK